MIVGARGNKGKIGWGAVLDEVEQRVGVQMGRDQVAEQVELSGPHGGEARVGRRLETGPAGKAGHSAQQGATEGVVLQQPVPVGAQHVATIATLSIGTLPHVGNQ